MRPDRVKVAVLGDSHLAETHRRVSGMIADVVQLVDGPDLVFVAQDVYDHQDVEQLEPVEALLDSALAGSKRSVVVLSQVPPGWVERVCPTDSLDRVFTQVDTIIMKHAFDRVASPEQYIIGSQSPNLPLCYQQYLWQLGAWSTVPIVITDHTTAELAKSAINYMLTVQIAAANRLAGAAQRVNADWSAVESVLRHDQRIGPYAYVRPGKPNQHLLRDANTIGILNGTSNSDPTGFDDQTEYHEPPVTEDG